MTETTEAKQKWCPFVRVDVFDGGNHHLYAINDKCRASDCMAWRELTTTTTVTDPPGANEVTVSCGGYCGLAGKP